MKTSYVIFGAGGHAKVILELILELGFTVDCVFDDNASTAFFWETNIPLRKYDPALFPEAKLIIALGNNSVRSKISGVVQHAFGTLIHPSAAISASATIGLGSVVLSNAVVQAGAVIGKHVIINASACVDHEATIQDFVHISPITYIGSAALIMEGVTVYPGTVVTRNTIVQP